MKPTPRGAPRRYLHLVRRLLDEFRRERLGVLEVVAAEVASRLDAGGVLFAFGTGHSHMLAEEIFYRAGGLVPVVPMLDPRVLLSTGALRSTEAERESGLAESVARNYDLRRGDVGFVISHSGANAAPLEMASLMKQKGLYVVALTSLEHRARSRAKLHVADVAHAVLDTGVPHGDASLEIPGVLHPAGPASTVVGAAILQALVLRVLERLGSGGRIVVNLPSANVDGAERERVLRELEKYRERLRHW
ncbi:MAG: hypothetical protein KatS3mg076_2200 [Candidatus Binatia bacterium]|nr:MAG: hypothetical protein KatS3mg076_2200 [Candidatus Binatia bacterium]